MTEPTAHVDTFCRDSLPPPELMPQMDYSVLPELAYPARLNAAAELLDRRIAAGDGERTVFLFYGGRWTYRHLLETANRIAHVLVEDLGIVPGNRVLLRGPNHPMLAACWLAVLKAGGVAVCTMPLLRVRELTHIAAKAKIHLALTDTRVAADCEQAMAGGAGGRVVHFNSAQPGSLESLMNDKPDTFDNCDTAADDAAFLASTSIATCSRPATAFRPTSSKRSRTTSSAALPPSPSPSASAASSSSPCASAPRRCCCNRPRRHSFCKGFRTIARRSSSPRRPPTAP